MLGPLRSVLSAQSALARGRFDAIDNGIKWVWIERLHCADKAAASLNVMGLTLEINND